MTILLFAVFGATLGVLLAAGRAMNPQPDPGRARLRALAAGLSPTAVADGPAPDHLITSTPHHLTRRRGRARGLQLELLRAGLKLRPPEYRAAAAASALALGAAGLLAPCPVASAAVLAVAGLCAPPAVLKALQAARVRKFEAQLADSLTLIASSLRSGYSFLRAIQVVGQEMPGPIAEEFRRAVAESNLGLPTEQALGQIVERVPSYDLELIVTAVNIQMQVGGNLAQILDTIAGTIRERVRNQREIAALTAEGKLSGVVCIAMPPVMFLLLWLGNPAYMLPLFQDPWGRLAMIAAGIMQVIGIFWTKAIVRIDV